MTLVVDRGVTVLVGFILMMMIMIIFVTILQTQYVPSIVRDAEIGHMNRVTREIIDLDDRIVRGESGTVPLDMGVEYPRHLFLMTPQTGACSISAYDSFVNVSGKAGDFEFKLRYKTKRIVLKLNYLANPDYNLIYENTAVFKTPNITLSHQNMFSRGYVNIYIVNTSFDSISSNKPIDLTISPISVPNGVGGVYVEKAEIEFETLNPDYWNDVLRDLGYDPVVEGGKVKVEVSNVTVRFYYMHVGTSQVSQSLSPMRIIKLNYGNISIYQGQSIVLGVRVLDDFFNPISGVHVSVDVGGDVGSVDKSVGYTNWRGEFYVRFDAVNEERVGYVEFNTDGLSARYNISVKSVTGEISTPYTIHWERKEYFVTFTTGKSEKIEMRAYTSPKVVNVDVQFATDQPTNLAKFEPNSSKTNDTGWVSTNLTIIKDIVSDYLKVIKVYVLSWFAGDSAVVNIYKTLTWIVSDYENFSMCELHNTQIVDDYVRLKSNVSWLNGWKFRRVVEIQSERDLEDYQIKVVLNSKNFDFSKVREDGCDIRFTDSDGVTLLNYWIERWDYGDEAVIWVKVPSISRTKKIYIYYGNSSADCMSNANLVFDFFDDFNDGDVSDWRMEKNVMRGHVEVSEEYYNSHPYSLVTFFNAPYEGWGRNRYVRAYKSFSINENFDYVIEFYTKSGPCVGCKIYSEMFIDGKRVFKENIQGGMVHRSVKVHLNRGSHEIKVGMLTTAAWYGRFPAWFDDIIVRKFVDPEPSVSICEEETPTYLNYGYVRSYVKDLGQNSTIKFLQWNGYIPSGTEMEFWIKTEKSQWIYVGRASESSNFNLQLEGRYVEWNVTLRTDNEKETPMLDGVVVGYIPR